MNSTNETFLTNLEIERTRLGKTQKEFADLLCMSLSNYKKLIAGDVVKIPKYEIAHALYNYTNKTIYELCEDDADEVELIKHYRNLSPQMKRNILAIMELEEAISVKESGSGEMIPCYTLTGNMVDGMMFDSSNIEFIDVLNHQKFFANSIDCAIRITSNHYHPVYHLGDILLIHQTAPRDGDTGIFIDSQTNKLYIRKFKQTQPCELIPVNGLGRTFYVDSYNQADMNRWIKFGYVLTKMR